MLDFARVERGRQAYDFAYGSVGDAVSKAVNVYRYRAESEGVDLAADVDPALPLAHIDERAIQLAVINLIDNALKYAPGTDVVTVRATYERGAIVVRVIDCGPGVPIEDRERIFERFVRGSTARPSGAAPGVRGSGIGLSLVKHIAESHGGRVWVEAETLRGPGRPGSAGGGGIEGGVALAGAAGFRAGGRGATFVMTIPAGAEAGGNGGVGRGAAG